METLSSNNTAFQHIKEYLEEWFAAKESTVAIFYHDNTLVLDHKDALFIKPIEGYYEVIKSKDKHTAATIQLYQQMLSGYIERVKINHLYLFRSSYHSLKEAQIEIVEVRIKGKMIFQLNEQELLEAYKRRRDKFFEKER